MASLPVNCSWPGTELSVMLAGVARPGHVMSSAPVLTQPARERAGDTGNTSADKSVAKN